MEHRDIYADDHHWGDSAVDINKRDLPALKVRYIIHALPRTGRLLEVGSGGGRMLNTIAFHRPELELHGCDIRPMGYKPTNYQFTLVTPNSKDLPYAKQSFDAVVAFDFLEHVTEPVTMLHSVKQVLRPGSPLISFTPLEGNPLSFYRLYRRLLGDDLYVKTKEHIQAYSERELVGLVSREFRVLNRTYAYHFIGQFMDATLFALLKIPALRKRFWEANPFYAETQTRDATPAASRSPLEFALRAGNALAYAESRALSRCRFGATGLLFTAAS